MKLPRLVLVADSFTDRAVAENVLKAVDAGVRWVQLRDHQADSDRFRQVAADLVSALRGRVPSMKISINTDVETAAALGCDLHLGSRGPRIASAGARLGEGFCIGYSAHAASEAAEAVQEGAGYVFFSPVFATASKPGQAGAGIASLQACCREVSGTPVYALGGVTPDRVRACMAAGAYGVAVLSGILNTPDPADAAMAYLNEISIHQPLHS